MAEKWMTRDEAAEVLEVSPGNVGRMAARAGLTRTYDEVGALGRPRYLRREVLALARARARDLDSSRWLTSAEASAALGLSVRGFAKLRTTHPVRTNQATADHHVRYSAQDVAALVKARGRAESRYLTERQAAEELGGSTALSAAMATGVPLGYNPRTRRYSRARVRELVEQRRSDAGARGAREAMRTSGARTDRPCR